MSADPRPEEAASVAAWWRAHRALSERFGTPAALALVGGFAADRPGWAFGSGYQAAGRALFGPSAGAWEREEIGALCASEEGGAHPKAIETRLERGSDGQLRLYGSKRFVSFGPEASRWLIVAHEGIDEEGRKRLRVASITAREGARFVPMDALPFVPEVPHGLLHLEGAVVEDRELLPGDGYLRYLKPFRTVEDIHVHLALTGWLIGAGRRGGWPVERIEALVALCGTFFALSSASPSAPSAHVALGGALKMAEAAIKELDPLWERARPEDRERWMRDRPLLSIASKARSLRLAAAWRRLGASPSKG